MKKIRIDQLLVERELAPTRAKAQALVMAGVVFCGTQKIEKSSQTFEPSAPIHVKQKDHPYVGRGGVKLKAALDYFKYPIAEKICLDVGASTGGFTDCLLQAGAKKVYALDVGYGQLDSRLRNDPRVVVLEKINFRNYDFKDLTNPIDVVTVDVSFISLELILPKVAELFQKKVNAQAFDNSTLLTTGPIGFDSAQPPVPERSRRTGTHSEKYLIALIKPQFEVGPKNVGKGGVVTSEEKRSEAVLKIKHLCEKLGFKIDEIIPSPLKGAQGNVEYLLGGTLL
ncbi:MAG TPA: TlyA family rRNA (cytidine-2'-O)-methyltransferase [Deltaproteobacteria bacterium]|nr:MAG: hypothetical protein A2048_03650 [Deltaproteobacteria bacterium GWA2_45_12]HBF13235.1 TlyA family rRNA (cytidine-2'-O)-methyltransferase [Deltaproteobacteria bacterium]